MKRVNEADVLVGEMPYGLRTIWRGAHARPLRGCKQPQPKRKRGYYRALLRNERWALELREYINKGKQFVEYYLNKGE